MGFARRLFKIEPGEGRAVGPVLALMFLAVAGLTLGESAISAMFFARVLTNTGLSRRVALLFVRRFGDSALGFVYSLVLTDVTLAGGIPSITARSGGIILPDTAKQKPQRGTVVAVGTGRLLDDGSRAAMTLKVGDRVFYSKYGGNEVTVDGTEYLILDLDSVYATVE